MTRKIPSAVWMGICMIIMASPLLVGIGIEGCHRRQDRPAQQHISTNTTPKPNRSIYYGDFTLKGNHASFSIPGSQDARLFLDAQDTGGVELETATLFQDGRITYHIEARESYGLEGATIRFIQVDGWFD